tara:strand:- start:165 stop:416 length:252 start_codon:yes stop_codon:yes gene_type:complete
MSYRKDKLGWIKFNPSYYKNNQFPNIVIYRINAPGVLYPWGIRSGYWKDGKFFFDGKLDKGGMQCWDKLECHEIAEQYQKGLQ